MLLCLRDEGVDFLIVGAYALAAHGFPRATADLDIWVRNSFENAEKVMRALMRFGAPSSDLSASDFVAPDTVVQLGIEPCRIDLLTAISGVSFDEAWQSRIKVAIGDLEVDVLSKELLLKNKLAAARDKDQGDINWLKKN
jgi:Nucleotidyl transferase of unknown function (DUF2204)